jgi:hypothetical protein
MSDFAIETQIDKFVDLLSKKRKIAFSEAARVLNVKESQLDEWVTTLEDRGVVELKYPVLGEPEIVLKGILPDNIKLVPEKEEVIKEPTKFESEEIENKIEPSYERTEQEESEIKSLEEKLSDLEKRMSLDNEEKEIKGLTEKITNLEKDVLGVTEEMDVSKLKEELFETLIIISTLDDVEKINYYLSFIERIVLALKTKNAWDNVDKDLMVSALKSTAESWKTYGKEDMSKTFEEMYKKIEMI